MGECTFSLSFLTDGATTNNESKQAFDLLVSFGVYSLASLHVKERHLKISVRTCFMLSKIFYI